jgi:hypothetical protein
MEEMKKKARVGTKGTWNVSEAEGIMNACKQATVVMIAYHYILPPFKRETCRSGPFP